MKKIKIGVFRNYIGINQYQGHYWQIDTGKFSIRSCNIYENYTDALKEAKKFIRYNLAKPYEIITGERR